MITVFLRGGLGNQMFQYACGLAMAKKKNTGLILDTVFLKDRFPRINFTRRDYSLDVFKIEPRFTRLSALAGKISIPGLWLGMDLLGIIFRHFAGVAKIVREKDERFLKNDSKGGSTALLFGWWQSEKHFKDIEDDVRAAFRFRYPLSGPAADTAAEIKNSQSISLHVRRGDYVLPMNQKRYGEVGQAYYSAAVHYLADKVANPKVFIFSDDVAWCREHLKLSLPTFYVDDALSGPKGSHHLELMSLCKHNIVANSSFSWWGAWLNNNPQKIVIAPKRWMTEPGNSGDIAPENWIRL